MKLRRVLCKTRSSLNIRVTLTPGHLITFSLGASSPRELDREALLPAGTSGWENNKQQNTFHKTDTSGMISNIFDIEVWLENYDVN